VRNEPRRIGLQAGSVFSRLQAFFRSEAGFAALLLLPAVALIVAVVIFPLVRLFWTSLNDLRLASGLPASFVGVENFAFALDDARFWRTLRVTALYTLITVPGGLIVGMGLALLANLPFRRRWPVRLALLIPWALPLVFAGLIFRWLFEFDYGIVNDLIIRLGGTPQRWLSDATLALVATSIAIIWKTSSFVALILLAGLQALPDDVYEAARLDGANAWQRFVFITLPLLMPSIMVALIFRTITAIQTFDIPLAMTRGGPGNATETLAMYIRTTTLDYLDLGYGSALAVIVLVLSLALTSLYFSRIIGSTPR
jgi:multiple sugar transport system permease protein